MRNDERLRTIYEVMAPYIVRSERNWRDYLAFASRFHKQSFDNILLVYAQDEDVTILATKKQWAGVGRNLISRPKGIAVCVYSNARLTLDYLFDISQTVGREIHPTNWQLSDEMQKALGERLTFSHGFQTQPFPDLLYALAREAVNDNYGYLKSPDDKNQLVVDDYAAEVVRDIFRWKLEGMSQQGIADRLNADGVLSPSEYKRSLGMKYISGFKSNPQAKWSAVAVGRILKNPLYIGVMVQGKTGRPNYKIKKLMEKPKDEWIRVPGAHEPIISEVDFRTVSGLLCRDTRIAVQKKTVYQWPVYYGHSQKVQYRRSADPAAKEAATSGEPKVELRRPE